MTLNTGDTLRKCRFCENDQSSNYECPRCNSVYCSLKCYKSEAHQSCSEAFYRDCVKQELHGKTVENDEFSNVLDSGRSSEKHDEDEANENGSDSDDCYELTKNGEGESDSESETAYLQKVVADSLAQVDDGDENALDRRLTAAGLGTTNEGLLSTLSSEELKEFNRLLSDIQIEEEGYGSSVFVKK